MLDAQHRHIAEQNKVVNELEIRIAKLIQENHDLRRDLDAYEAFLKWVETNHPDLVTAYKVILRLEK